MPGAEGAPTTELSKGAAMSLSREFAAFVADLNYEDLPPEVVDRAKGVTLQALSSALVAHQMPGSRQALALMQEEEAGGGGAATVLCNGRKLTKGGAAFVNAGMIFARGTGGTCRMRTHPGLATPPPAPGAAGEGRADGGEKRRAKERRASTTLMRAATAASCASASPVTTGRTSTRSPKVSAAAGSSSRPSTASTRPPATTSPMSM